MVGFIAICLLLSPAFCFITVSNNRLYDEQNRERIFHGVNVVVKNPPYIPKTNEFNLINSFNERDMEFLRSWGMNAIRLGVMWPGVEPTEGKYNYTYLSEMNRIVKLAGEYGIYTLVQFHQDLFSEKFCADGVPMWAIPQSISKGFPMPLKKPQPYDNATGRPTYQTCNLSWGEYYTTFSVNRGFRALYTNKHKLLDKFTAYWENIAITFKQNPYVLAYELINEPWPGNMYKNPTVMIPNLSQRYNLQRVYDKVSLAIRKHDPNHAICFQPVTWLNVIPSGFQHPPGGKRYANQSIFCYHYYNPPTIHLQGFMKTRMSDIKRLGTGGLLSEFYIIGSQGQKNSAMMDLCDENHQSWLGWIYKEYGGYPTDEKTTKMAKQLGDSSFFYNADGTPKVEAVRLIARSYAPIVAGQTISQSYDSVTRDFTLGYYICKKCGQTVVFANKQIIYTNGYSLTIVPSSKVSYVVQGNYIRITPTAAASDGDRILVSIIGL